MKRIPNTVIVGISLLTVAAGCTGVCLNARVRAAEAAAVRGRYSADQIIAVGNRLCARLAPGLPIQRSDAYYHEFVESTGAPLRVWAVDCTAQDGADLAFAWNADTGRLLRVSMTAQPAHGAAALLAGDAVRCSLAYLRELGFGRRNAAWRVAEPPSRNRLAWVVRFRAGASTALVHIDATDGSIRYATVL